MNLLVFILGVTFFLCCLASELVYLITQTIRLVILIRTLKNSYVLSFKNEKIAKLKTASIAFGRSLAVFN